MNSFFNPALGQKIKKIIDVSSRARSGQSSKCLLFIFFFFFFYVSFEDKLFRKTRLCFMWEFAIFFSLSANSFITNYNKLSSYSSLSSASAAAAPRVTHKPHTLSCNSCKSVGVCVCGGGGYKCLRDSVTLYDPQSRRFSRLINSQMKAPEVELRVNRVRSSRSALKLG